MHCSLILAVYDCSTRSVNKSYHWSNPPAGTSSSWPTAVIWTHRNKKLTRERWHSQLFRVTCLLRSLMFSMFQLDKFLFTNVGDISEVGIVPLRSYVLHFSSTLPRNSLVMQANRVVPFAVVYFACFLQRVGQLEVIKKSDGEQEKGCRERISSRFPRRDFTRAVLAANQGEVHVRHWSRHREMWLDAQVPSVLASLTIAAG